MLVTVELDVLLAPDELGVLVVKFDVADVGLPVVLVVKFNAGLLVVVNVVTVDDVAAVVVAFVAAGAEHAAR